jgi:hypothetical protein
LSTYFTNKNLESRYQLKTGHIPNGIKNRDINGLDHEKTWFVFAGNSGMHELLFPNKFKFV